MRQDGAVVVGWLGRASTTLHCTHHVTHEGSRDTSVFFLFLFDIFVVLSSSVTVGGDRAVLTGIMQIVTSAVRVLLIGLFAMAEPWSCRVRFAAMALLLWSALLGCLENCVRVIRRGWYRCHFSLSGRRIRRQSATSVSNGESVDSCFFRVCDAHTCLGTNVALVFWKYRQKFPC